MYDVGFAASAASEFRRLPADAKRRAIPVIDAIIRR